MKQKVSLVSLGCPKNLVDAEVMLGHLPADRFEIVTDEAQADIIIVNTCSFIKEAKQESIDTILDLAELPIDFTVTALYDNSGKNEYPPVHLSLIHKVVQPAMRSIP